jgi:hypothetical protein
LWLEGGSQGLEKFNDTMERMDKEQQAIRARRAAQKARQKAVQRYQDTFCAVSEERKRSVPIMMRALGDGR